MLTIIGGSGFIGTRLSNQLKSQNIDFKIVDIQKVKLILKSGSLGM